ncbi:ketopantoate reductase family protein [Aliikangiella sp. G2MR2-5]|uniref:ketopantoate reductase family protein n=1 Tax=Aliikangiella sp. G2MR2-5 TaxID=2788943 RepID=UPI0018A88DBF|nr:ketopantoate reductase family protein [Aliikangiella sp. G2MR2-5]
MPKFNYNIIGAGSVGHLWAAFLLKNGNSVSLYSQRALNTQKLRLVSPLLDSSQPFEFEISYQTFDSWQACDLCLVCQKTHQLGKVAQTLASLKTPPRTIILMMNGMGLVEVLQRSLPQSRIFHAYLTHGVYRSNNQIIHAGVGDTLIGNMNSHYSPSEFKHFIDELNSSLPKVAWSNEHKLQMNLKLIINAVINPLTALSGQPNGCLLDSASIQSQARSLLKEFEPVTKFLLPELPLQDVSEAVFAVAESTRNNKSSMLQDVERKNQTEIDSINGYLSSVAESIGVTLPQNNDLVNKIKSLY